MQKVVHQRMLGASPARPERLLRTLRHRRRLQIEHQQGHRNREYPIAQRRQAIQTTACESVIAHRHPSADRTVLLGQIRKTRRKRAATRGSRSGAIDRDRLRVPSAAERAPPLAISEASGHAAGGRLSSDTNLSSERRSRAALAQPGGTAPQYAAVGSEPSSCSVGSAATSPVVDETAEMDEMEQPWRRAVPAGARRLVFVRTSSRKRCDKALAVCRVRRKQHSGDLFPNARKSRNYGASDYLAMTTHVRSLSNAASAKGALGLPCYAATLACRRVMAASWRLRARHILDGSSRGQPARREARRR